jgi:hypothetical protein
MLVRQRLHLFNAQRMRSLVERCEGCDIAGNLLPGSACAISDQDVDAHETVVEHTLRLREEQGPANQFGTNSSP